MCPSATGTGATLQWERTNAYNYRARNWPVGNSSHHQMNKNVVVLVSPGHLGKKWGVVLVETQKYAW